jgi:hypothetical protein
MHFALKFECERNKFSARRVKRPILQISQCVKKNYSPGEHGKITRELSHSVQISQSMIKFHITNIMKKLKASNNRTACSLDCDKKSTVVSILNPPQNAPTNLVHLSGCSIYKTYEKTAENLRWGA